jgi:hypothetical protein
MNLAQIFVLFRQSNLNPFYCVCRLRATVRGDVMFIQARRQVPHARVIGWYAIFLYAIKFNFLEENVLTQGRKWNCQCLVAVFSIIVLSF